MLNRIRAQSGHTSRFWAACKTRGEKVENDVFFISIYEFNIYLFFKKRWRQLLKGALVRRNMVHVIGNCYCFAPVIMFDNVGRVLKNKQVNYIISLPNAAIFGSCYIWLCLAKCPFMAQSDD